MASTDDAAVLKAFAKTNKANFPILSDPGGTIAKHYEVLKFGTFASRTTFIIDKQGKIIHIDTNVNPASSGQDLRNILEKLEQDTANGQL